MAKRQDWKEGNRAVAAALREAAGLLRQQDAGHFRVLAYQKAAATVEELEEDIVDVAARGIEALEALPNIGKRLAAAIFELVTTGRWSQLERLHGTLDPLLAFQRIPGVGPGLARLIHDHLHVDTLEALEAAAHDGRLQRVPGIGPRRVASFRDSLASLLGRGRGASRRREAEQAPAVDALLDVDREYRARALAGTLRRIAPRRFNPEGKAWLPILHTERGPWHFTVLFSNTARAHELGKTDDWVVIFFSGDHEPEGQCTVVTETSGPHKGRRVVRGREGESGLTASAHPAAADSEAVVPEAAVPESSSRVAPRLDSGMMSRERCP